MLESLTEILPLLIPVLALLIGLVIIGGLFVFQPLPKAITILADAQGPRLASPESDPRQIEQRIASLEGALHALLEEREFERGLHAGTDPVGTTFEATERGRDA